MAISSKRKKKILWFRITVVTVLIAVTSGVLTRVLPLTLVEHEVWSSTLHSSDGASHFTFVGYPKLSSGSETDAVTDELIRRAILVGKDEYEAGEVSVETDGKRLMIPIQELSFIEPDRERRNQLVSNLNDEIAAHPGEWGWTSVDVESHNEGNTTNEMSKYSSLTIWGRGSYFPISGFRYEYIASQATVEPRQIVQVHYEARSRLIAIATMLTSSALAIGCMLRLLYLWASERFVVTKGRFFKSGLKAK